MSGRGVHRSRVARRLAVTREVPNRASGAEEDPLLSLPRTEGRRKAPRWWRPPRSNGTALVTRAGAEGWGCYSTHDPGDLPIQLEATEKGSSGKEAL